MNEFLKFLQKNFAFYTSNSSKKLKLFVSIFFEKIINYFYIESIP